MSPPIWRCSRAKSACWRMTWRRASSNCGVSEASSCVSCKKYRGWSTRGPGSFLPFFCVGLSTNFSAASRELKAGGVLGALSSCSLARDSGSGGMVSAGAGATCAAGRGTGSTWRFSPAGATAEARHRSTKSRMVMSSGDADSAATQAAQKHWRKVSRCKGELNSIPRLSGLQ